MIAGIALCVIALAVLNRFSAGNQRPALGSAARRPRHRSQAGETAIGRDRAENAGGARHIRTYPSWRDRLE
ncbi:hypothetical protein [Nocardia sp. NPDC051570]|uniref:hypothetical protein n=1 Tax=Nocardia sp. NPDC051570 TaxID=3364324 RepID=UPI0037A97967